MSEELTRRQRRELDRDMVVIVDLGDLVIALRDALDAAHHAAATLTTGDTPASSWSGGGGGRPAGTHSDPTSTAVLGDNHVGSQLDTIRRLLIAHRDAGYRAHDAMRTLTAKLNAGDGSAKRKADDDLHDVNVGRGDCATCARHCEGQGSDRLRTVRAAGTLRHEVELRLCPACRAAWRRAIDTDATTDIWAWCDMRRRHIERTTATP